MSQGAISPERKYPARTQVVTPTSSERSPERKAGPCLQERDELIGDLGDDGVFADYGDACTKRQDSADFRGSCGAENLGLQDFCGKEETA
jgi:hypothetical protein